MVWLAASEACAWATLGNGEQAHEAIERAEQARDHVRINELDEMGGIATFSSPRQLHFAADALAWLPDEFSAAEDFARQAVEAYSDQTDPDWSYGSAAGSRAILAVARIRRAEVEGAAAALAPVLDLPAEQRINGIVQSVNRVHQALNHTFLSATARDLQERIESYALTPYSHAGEVAALCIGILRRARQEPRSEYYLAVDAVDDGLVGFARLGLNGVQAAKLGYAIAADYWGTRICHRRYPHAGRLRLSRTQAPSNTKLSQLVICERRQDRLWVACRHPLSELIVMCLPTAVRLG